MPDSPGAVRFGGDGVRAGRAGATTSRDVSDSPGAMRRGGDDIPRTRVLNPRSSGGRAEGVRHPAGGRHTNLVPNGFPPTAGGAMSDSCRTVGRHPAGWEKHAAPSSPLQGGENGQHTGGHLVPNCPPSHVLGAGSFDTVGLRRPVWTTGHNVPPDQARGEPADGTSWVHGG